MVNLSPREAAALLGDRASVLLLGSLTKHPGWPYLRKVIEAFIEGYEGGLPQTPDAGYKYQMAGVARKILNGALQVCEKQNPEPKDIAERELLKAIIKGETFTKEVQTQ